MAEAWSLFPGVYTSLQDTTTFVASTPSGAGFIVFMSEKGPDNQLLLYGRADQIATNHGTNINIAAYGQGQKIAMNYLLYSNTLYCIRVTPDHTNCPAMSNIYKDLYGKYQKASINMREASYANLGIAVNENGEFEFIHVGPEDLGDIISLDTYDPPANPNLNDRYYLPFEVAGGKKLTGQWATIKDYYGAGRDWSKEGTIAICIKKDPVEWIFKEVSDTSIATVDGTPMVAAVTYNFYATVSEWQEYSNTYTSQGKYAEVKDIIYELPEGEPEDGDAYLIAANASDPNLLGHGNEVLVYVETLDEWFFESYNKVFVDRDYIFTDEPDPSPNVGDRYIIMQDENNLKYSAWAGHNKQIVEWTGSTGWRYITFEVANPEDTEKFQSLVLDEYIDELTTRRMEFKSTNLFIKDIIWTTDMNASFVAYAHRMVQFDDIVTASHPTDSIDNASIEPFILFYPVGRGSYYNGMYIDMRLGKRAIHEENDFNRTIIVDIYDTIDGNKLKVETFEVSFNPHKQDFSGNSLFIADVINKYSNYIRVSCDSEKFDEEFNFCKNIHSDLELLFQKYTLKNSVGSTSNPPRLQHGDDGSIWDKYGNLDWEQATQLLVKAYTGLLSNPTSKDSVNSYETDVLDRERVLLDLVFDAGYPEDVKYAIESLIEARHQDCFGIIDLGDNASAKAAYEARINGIGASFNSPFIAIYEPYSMVYDVYSGKDIWVSPVYHAARAYALTDKNWGRHHAPAGINRGMCPEVKKLRYNLNREEAYQDLFMTYNINPIIQNRDGFVIWNNSTSYLKSSKFQDINVVRIVLKIKRDIEFALREFIFELNEGTTYQKINQSVSSYLANLQGEGAITNGTCSVYASDYDITQHKVRVDVTITPKQVLYQILLTISV